MSTKRPAVSKSPSISRRFSPLSITCVSPDVRGLPGRSGSPRKPSWLDAGKDLLQLLLRRGLHLVVERVAVRVDSDRKRPEVPDTELPEALRHQLLPGDLLDLLDLGRLERSRAADDREVDHAEPLHRLDRLVGEAALAADRAHAVLGAERLGEAHHPRRGRGADADLLVSAGSDLSDIGGGVKQEAPAKVHRRLDALVEDTDLRPVADADDVALDGHLVAGAQLQDLGRVGDREGDLVRRHQPATSTRVRAWPAAERKPTPPPRVGRPPATLSADSTACPARGLSRMRDNSSTGGPGAVGCRAMPLVTVMPPGRSRRRRPRSRARLRAGPPSTDS